MAVAAALIGRQVVGGAIAFVFTVLLMLDFMGTGMAAYLLEAWILLVLDILAAIAWLITFATPRSLPATS